MRTTRLQVGGVELYERVGSRARESHSIQHECEWLPTRFYYYTAGCYLISIVHGVRSCDCANVKLVRTRSFQYHPILYSYLIHAAHIGSGMDSSGLIPSASDPPWGRGAELRMSRISDFAAYVAPPYVATAVAQATAWRMNAVCVHDAQVRP